MPENPTTEGSIVAYLRLDPSDYNAQLDKAKAKAEELGRTDPTIRVKADTANVVAKLDAVEAARRRVTAAEIKYGVAADLATSAADRQWRVNQRLTASEEEKQRATDASTRATGKADLAALVLTEAEDRLAAAERKAAVGALEQAAAQDVATGAGKKAAAGNKMNVTQMGLIAAAVAVLVPMLAPLAGYAVAVAGALTMMGGAGILAILGIKNAMAAGTQQGALFSAGMQTLKSDLSQLEGTAAGAMLSSFDGAIRSINQAMPQLNGQIGQFSGMLGTVGNTVLQGVINALQVLNPLFVSAGTYVEQLAAGFLSWTTDGGLQSFATYAMQALPQVEQTLGSLAAAIIHILDALAPLGVVGLAVIQGLSDVINWFPNNVLLDVAAGASAAFVAFKLWGLLVPIIKSVGVAVGVTAAVTDAALGPIGLIVAAIGAMAAIWAVSSVAANQATASTQSYMDALRQDNGVIGENVRAQAAKALVDDGAIRAGKALGLTAQTVTDAALGQVPAMQAVNDAVAKATQSYQEAKFVSEQYGAGSAASVAADKAKSDAAKTLKAAVDAQNAAVQNAITNGIDYNAAMNLGGSVAQTMASNLGLTIDAYNALVTAQNNATAASKTWKSEMDILNGAALGYAAAQNQFDSLIANAPKVTSKTKGGASASQIAAAQNSAATATSSHANAVTALGIAQTKYNNAVAKNNAQPTAAHALSVRQAQLALSRAQATVASTAGSASAAQGRLTAAQQKGTTTVTSGTSAVYGSTAAAVANRSALVSQITAAEAAATAFRNQGGSATETRAKLVAMKAEIIKNAIANGENADQVQKYVDNIFKIPPKVFSVADFNASQATAAMEAYKNGLKLIPMTVFTNIEALISAAPAGAPVAGAAHQGRAFFAGGGMVSQYKAAGGPIEAAYLASGGNPFRPRGTDTVPAMLTPGEFVVKRSSARYASGFLDAYNQNPQKALASVAAPPQQGPMRITGTLDLGNGLTGLINGIVHSQFDRAAVQMSGGLV